MTQASDRETEGSELLRCRGVRTHNLKNVDVEFKIGEWTAVTGVSGSGKSSLVFDTIYAEAQRRFLETLGTYERQFLQGLPQGDFDSVENVPAAVALKQSNRSSDPRSLIGTSADLFDPLRQIFFGLMESSCAKCGSVVEVHRSSDLKSFTNSLLKQPDARVVLSVPFELPTDTKKRNEVAKSLLLEGYLRLVEGNNFVNLEESLQGGTLAKVGSKIEIALDRLTSNVDTAELENRLETVWSQVRFSPRFSQVFVSSLKSGELKRESVFMVQPYCKKCESHTNLIQSSDLDWQSVLGACSTCKGLGNVPIIDMNKVYPDKRLSIEKGAIKPWTTDTFVWMQDTLVKVLKANGVKTDVPFEKLDAYTQNFIWSGDDPEEQFKKNRKDFVSLKEFFDVLETERYKRNSRILLAKYRKYITCLDCEGTRLGKAGRNARCGGKAFFEIMHSEISESLKWTESLREVPKYQKRLEAISEVYEEVVKKLLLLSRLGLGSSSLARRCKSLSGGEYQRVLLTRVIGNGLTDALYVLDEPSIGLGEHEYKELIECIKDLRNLGNTVLMVEHEPSLVRAADKWIELGPGGGIEGGAVLPSEGRNEPASFKVTSAIEPLDGFKRESVDVGRPIFDAKSSLVLSGFSMLNCKDLLLEVPLGKLTVITGPSGAGKSTLVQYGLAAALELLEDHGKLSNSDADIDNGLGVWDKLRAPAQFLKNHAVVSVKQKAMHRSITSVVATVLGLMDELRKQFASTEDAREFGLTASDFSFNGGGACETCDGRGFIKEDLFFLGEVEKECPDCHGRRYRDEVLEIQWNGKNISEWLSTNLKQCMSALRQYPKLASTLYLANQLGLGHLPLGAATSEISGGEAQRLRLCSALSAGETKVFCILDEPSRGLSEKDVGDLIITLLALCSQGHTFVIVEHHELFRKFSHQLISMGPGAGIHGGRIIKREVLC